MSVINTPIKIHGKKRKIIPFLKENISIPKDYIYVEPFLGSGVVAFNLLPEKAILSDINFHIIYLYKHIQEKLITQENIRDYLDYHGQELLKIGESYYYYMRNQFNSNIDKYLNDNTYSLDMTKQFIFLNFSSFNGLIRFNSKLHFNTPFCKKTDRFSKAFISKIVNQIKTVSDILTNQGKNWRFEISHYDNILYKLDKNEKYIIYLDPPYLSLTGYFGCNWTIEDERKLKDFCKDITKDGNNIFYLSNWLNKHSGETVNSSIVDIWLSDSEFPLELLKQEHYYYLAGNPDNRSSVVEVLITNK